MTDEQIRARVDVHGARGSSAVSGRAFRRYGGHTSCYGIRLPDGHHLIVDAGSGLARLQAGLEDSARQAFEATVLLTHFHWDHIQGLPTFAPLYEPSTRLHVIAAPPPGMTVREALAAVLRPPWFPVRLDDCQARITFEAIGEGPIGVGPLQIRGAPLRHPAGVTGYRIEHGGGALVVATDVEAGEAQHDAALRRLAADASVLIHDAQYLPGEYADRRQGWGHSTWEHAVEAAADAGVHRLVLTSHEPSRTDDEVDAIVEAARTRFPATEAAYEGQVLEF